MATLRELHELSDYLRQMVADEVGMLLEMHDSMNNAADCYGLTRLLSAHLLAGVCSAKSEDEGREVFSRFCAEYRNRERMLRRKLAAKGE